MLSNSLEQKDLEALLHPSTDLFTHAQTGPLVLVRGKGVTVWDNRGKDYIEGMAGLWCTSLGYGVDELAEAGAAQLREMPFTHLFGGRSNAPAIELADRLKEMMPFPASKIFFGNSGSDANDSQVKMMWYYNNAIGRPQKKKIIARDRGYHGVTVASGSLTGLPAFHRDFDLPKIPVLRTAAPDAYRGPAPGESEAAFSARLAAELEALILAEDPETIAAFIAEPVSAAGGVVIPPEGYYPAITAVLKKYDIAFIDDEVVCGFGRTGAMFGAQHYGFTPDTVTVAKALSSAYLPISAVAIGEPMYQAFVEQSGRIGTFGHGFTYSGHPVCAAVALKTLELMEEWQVLDHVNRVAPRFQARLAGFAGHPLVGDARGVGLIGAVELVRDKAAKAKFDAGLKLGYRVQEAAAAEGVITRPLGDTMAFCPPLVITEAEIDEMFDRFGRALDRVLADLPAGALA